MLDERDHTILAILQEDAEYPINKLASLLNLSASACWHRIKRLEDERYIARRVVVLNREQMGVATTVYVLIKTSDHSMGWLESFRTLIADTPEIVETHRLTGDVDYLLKVVLPDVRHWDVVYKRLVGKLQFSDISASISMEEVKSTTSVPTRYA